MERGSLDGVKDDKYNCIDFVVISKIYAMQDTTFFRMVSFYRIYLVFCTDKAA